MPDLKLMRSYQSLKKYILSDAGVLILIASGWLVFLTIVNAISATQYGFHRDELLFIDNGRHLAWGYIEYPPFTPLVAHLALGVFGLSVVGLRFTAALAVCASLVFSGLIARELGGSRWAQGMTAIAVATGPLLLFDAFFFSYQTFDYMFWVLTAFFVVRLLKTNHAKWWLAIGAVIGLGLMNKYNMIFLAAGIGLGVLFTPARRFLKSPWLWGGVLLAFLIFLPTLLWQVQHQFITLTYQTATHARDIQLGRTGSYLLGQVYVCINIATIVLCFNGLRFYTLLPEGKPYRPIAWMFFVPFFFFLAAQGRDYYLAAAYPMLIASGICRMEQRLGSEDGQKQKNQKRSLASGLAVSGLMRLLLILPLAPVNSSWWNIAMSLNGEMREEIGWPEMAATVREIYAAMPVEQQAQTGILAGNYGETAAIDLYGPALGLPQAISGTNTYWLRGYGDPPPQTFIVLGFTQDQVEWRFESCRLAGHTSNKYGVKNEETVYHPDIFVCHDLRQSWPDFWRSLQSFG
jgi:hypothetical protein